MTINDIMIREIAEAEREERTAERAAEQRGIAQGERLVGWAAAAGGVLLGATLALLVWCLVSNVPHWYPKQSASSAERTR